MSDEESSEDNQENEESLEREEKKILSLSITIKEKEVLHAAYMHFLKTGGLFIPTPKKFKLGTIINMQLHILDQGRFNVTGRIVWITPKGAQGNRAPGIGVSFDNDQGKGLKDIIEKNLAGFLDSDKPTHTF